MKLSLKSIAVGAAFAAVSLGAAVTASPAQALTVGSTFTFLSFGEAGGTLDFRTNPSVPSPGVPGSVTGLFIDATPFAGGQGTIQDVSANFSGTLANFIDMPGTDLDFTLKSLTGSGDVFNFSGFFADNTPGIGKLTFSLSSFPGSPVSVPTVAGSLTATAVPTPALLPGLIGMGVAALRKRQNEENQAETVDAEA